MTGNSTIGTGHKIATGVISMLFMVFAGLQYNDPDPEVWISLYAVCAGIGIWLIFKPISWWLLAICTGLYLVGGILLWPTEFHGLTGKMSEHHSIELARESLGLFICAGALVYYAVISKKAETRHL